MYNYFMLIGKVVSFNIENDESTNEIKGGTLEIDVKNGFKSINGTFKSNTFFITLNDTLTFMMKEIIKEGYMIAVKGHLENDTDKITLIGERIILISGQSN